MKAVIQTQGWLLEPLHNSNAELPVVYTLILPLCEPHTGLFSSAISSSHINKNNRLCLGGVLRDGARASRPSLGVYPDALQGGPLTCGIGREGPDDSRIPPLYDSSAVTDMSSLHSSPMTSGFLTKI